MDIQKMTEKIIGKQNLYGNTKVDLNPIMEKLKELKTLAQRYQSGTPAKIDFSPLISKLKDAEKLGYDLQNKARTLKI